MSEACLDRRGHQFCDADGNRVYSTCQRGCGASDPGPRIVVSWDGVEHYLTIDRGVAMLRDLARALATSTSVDKLLAALLAQEPASLEPATVRSVASKSPSRPEHNDGPRSECPGCVHADALRAEAITAAREQLASIDPTDAYIVADRLSRLLLAVLGEEP